jgi:hypothetical protein
MVNPRIFRVLGLMVFLAIACQNHNSDTAFIHGKWTLGKVTLEESNDTLGSALLALALAKTGGDYFHFTPEGQFQVLDANDSLIAAEQYEVQGQQQHLIIKQEKQGALVRDTIGHIMRETPGRLKIEMKKGRSVILKRKK